MLFWILVALLSAFVTYWVTRPLLVDDNAAIDPATADVAVYKDQLAEIDADIASGQLDETEAEAARAEVARRLLRQTQTSRPSTAVNSSLEPTHKWLHTAATLTLPLASLALYLTYGNPALPSQPFKDRLAASPDKASPSDLIAKVEERLRMEPNDGKGWEVIAPVYVAQGRYEDAIEAFANAIRLLGESPRRLEGLAMSQIRAANGLVTEGARRAFQRTLELDGTLVEPKLWLALAKEQDGKSVEAAADYKALIAQAPPDAPWRAAVEERLAAIDAPGKSASAPERPAAPAASGSNQGGVAALPAEQRAMIDTMVAGLAKRLKADGSDLEGWLKLMRSLKVLGRDGEAANAFADARKQFASDSKALQAIDELAKALGIGS